jgi:hypothetical protein
MTRHVLAAVCLALTLTASAQAQFSFSFGTGGGSGFSYGRGGYYGPGFYGPGFYGPGFYGPGYYGRGYPGYYGYGRSGVGIRIGSSGFYDDGYYGSRGYYYSRPQVNNYYVLPGNSVQAAPTAVLPSNKVTPTKLELAEGDILIRSPKDAPGGVGYGINDKWIYTIQPGEKQKLAAGRTWSIEFHRGIDGAKPARYQLDPGIYEFTYSDETGWDLALVSDSVLLEPADAAANAAKADKAADIGLPPEPPPEE